MGEQRAASLARRGQRRYAAIVPTPWDLLVLLLLMIALPVRAYLGMKHLRSVPASDLPRLRPQYHARGIAAQWTLTAIVAALWITHHRPLAQLLLVPRPTWGLAGVMIGTVGIAIAVQRQMSKLQQDPELVARISERLAPAGQLLPATSRDWPLFATFAVTAGICEELLFRGFIQWVLLSYVGLWPAVALQVIIFGVAHAYQGGAGILRTGFVGAFLTFVVLVSGSLYPAMLLHALMDLQAGRLALRLRELGQPLSEM
jgi:membrane protease YdiL (CAAX protease family)